MNRYQALGVRIREARERLGIDQGQLAGRIAPPVGQQAVSGWERGASRPRVGNLASIALVLGLDAEDLRVLGKYDGVVPPVAPLDMTLPFSALSEVEFEYFCRDLLAHENPGADTYRLGDRGHKQGGFDVICRSETDRIGVQVKRREAFGRADVAKVVSDADPRLGVTRPQIALSRETATPSARSEMDQHPNWRLFDGTQLSERVRNLPRERAISLVGIYFPEHVKRFLGVERPSMWLALDAWRPATFGGDHQAADLSLVGRLDELRKLQPLLDLPGVILVEGPAGVGKSRLVREVARLANREVRVAELALLSPEQFDMLPEGDPIVIVDDVELDSGKVSVVVRGVMRERPSASVVVAVSSARRKSLEDSLRADSDVGVSCVEVEDLSVEEACTLAALAADLPPGHEAAVAIGRLGYDCPMLIVEAGRRFATGEVSLADVMSSTELRELVLRKRLVALGLSPQSIRVLESVALFQPVHLDQQDDLRALELLSGVAGRDLELQVDSLQGAGLLRARGDSYRVVPDLLGESLVARQLRLKSGTPTGLAKNVAQVGGAPLVRAIENVAVADWHARRSGARAVPSDALWAELHTALDGQSAADQVAVLGALDDVAILNATAAIKLPLMVLGTDGSGTISELLPVISERTAVLGSFQIDTVARFVANAAWEADVLPVAIRVLFALGLEDERSEPQNPGHAMRLLRELGTYDPRRSDEHLDAYIETVRQLIEECEAGEARSTAVGLLEGAATTEAHWTSSNGRALSFRTVRFSPAHTKKHRYKVQEIASRELDHGNEAALSTVRVLDALVSTAEAAGEIEQVWKTLSVAATGVEFPTALSLGAYHALRHTKKFGGANAEVIARLAVPHPREDLDYILDRQLSSAWHNFDDFDDEDPRSAVEQLDTSARRRTQEVVDALQSQFSGGTEIVEHLGLRASSLDETNLSVSGFASLQLGLLNAKVCSPLQMLNYTDLPEGLAAQWAVVPLEALFNSDLNSALDETARLRRVLKHGDWVAAQVLSRSPQFIDAAMSSGLFQSLAGTRSGPVLEALALGSFRLDSAAIAVASVLELDVSVSLSVAERVAMVLASSRQTDGPLWKNMTAAQRQKVLDALAETPDIRDYHVEVLLNLQIADDPWSVVRLLQKRVMTAAGRDADFRPVPFGWEAKLRFDQTDVQGAIVKDLMSWYATVDGGRTRYEAREILEIACVGFGPTIVQIVTSFVKAGPSPLMPALHVILAAAPARLVFEEHQFVRELVEYAASDGPEMLDVVTSGLLSSAFPSFGSRGVGEPDPSDTARIDDASRILAAAPESAPWRPLYEQIKSRSEANIAWQTETDREFTEPRKW